MGRVFPLHFNKLGLLALPLLLYVTLGAAHADTGKRKLIIDDDGFSLMHHMLVNDPDLDVLGVTTVTGNVWARRGAVLALHGLEVAGRPDIPVFAGATYPLLNSEVLTDRWEALYGKLTWRGVWMRRWVEPTVQSLPKYYGPNDISDLPTVAAGHELSEENAVNFMIRMVHQFPGQVTIIGGGPLTNIALAQRLDPEFASLARELVYMGGSLNPQQALDNQSAAEFAREFAHSPRREFNIRLDPEAASIISRSPWHKITIVPVDPSTATQLSPNLIARLVKVSRPELAASLAKSANNFPLWDEITAGIWLDPSIIVEEETAFVDYNTQFGPGYGDLLSWRKGYEPRVGEQSAMIVRKIDARKLEALMVRLIGRGKK